MPYKNAEERRLKQKQYKREKREKERQTIDDVSSLPEINESNIKQVAKQELLVEERQTIYEVSSFKEEKQLFIYTITCGNGVKKVLPQTDAMLFNYRY